MQEDARDGEQHTEAEGCENDEESEKANEACSMDGTPTFGPQWAMVSPANGVGQLLAAQLPSTEMGVVLVTREEQGVRRLERVINSET